MSKKHKNISHVLWKNYIIMIFVSSILVIVPFLLMVIITDIMKDTLVSSKYTAHSLMCDDINKIDIDNVVKNHGGVQVITKDLKVLQLGGTHTLSSKKLSMTEWTNFLVKIQKEEWKDHTYTIAYNEKEQFWLVVEFPISLVFIVYYNFNTDSVHYNNMAWIMAGILLIYISLIIIGTITYSQITMRSFINPIKDLCKFVKELENGNFKKREKISNISEFSALQKGFNHLAAKLKEQESLRHQMQENKNRLIRDISHDLKNPLASIQGYAELYFKQKNLTEDIRIKYLNIIYNNSTRANALIQSLFQYSQVNSSDFKLNLQKTDLCELLRNQMASFIPVMEEKEVSYEINIPDEDILCIIDPLQINRVFNNLLDNAITYNAPGTQLMLSISQDKQNIIIELSDNGKGMDQSEAMYIFEPLVRADEKVRNSKHGGSGLGLAIVKRIIELHKGVITIETNPNKGCKFIIIINSLEI